MTDNPDIAALIARLRAAKASLQSHGVTIKEWDGSLYLEAADALAALSPAAPSPDIAALRERLIYLAKWHESQAWYFRQKDDFQLAQDQSDEAGVLRDCERALAALSPAARDEAPATWVSSHPLRDVDRPDYQAPMDGGYWGSNPLIVPRSQQEAFPAPAPPESGIVGEIDGWLEIPIAKEVDDDVRWWLEKGDKLLSRARDEIASFCMSYRMKCDEETKRQAARIASLEAEVARLNESLDAMQERAVNQAERNCALSAELARAKPVLEAARRWRDLNRTFESEIELSEAIRALDKERE